MATWRVSFSMLGTFLVSQGAEVPLAEAVVRSLGVMAGPVPALITLLAPLTLLAYTLSRKRHSLILLELAARRSP